MQLQVRADGYARHDTHTTWLIEVVRGAVSFATWFLTPFDPRTEIRVPEFGSFKNEVAVQLKKKKKPEAEVLNAYRRHDTTNDTTNDTTHTTHDTRHTTLTK
jgi:hypothetical protein